MDSFLDTIDPTIGRSCETEEDEKKSLDIAERNQSPPIITWCRGVSLETKSGLQADHAIVAVGPKSILYLRCLFQHWSQTCPVQLVGSCILGDAPMEAGALDPELNLKSNLIYTRQSEGQSFVYVLLGSSIPQERMFAFCAGVFSSFSATRVTLLGTMGTREYNSGPTPEPPHLCRLLTSHAKTQAARRKQARKAQAKQSTDTKERTGKTKQTKTEYLAPPSMHCGLAAHLLSHCEVYGLDAGLYLTMDSYHHEVAPITAFGKLHFMPALAPSPFPSSSSSSSSSSSPSSAGLLSQVLAVYDPLRSSFQRLPEFL